MSNPKLHPNVEKFKEFLQSNPSAVQKVRTGRKTWQEIYEDWLLLGEDERLWSGDGYDLPEVATENNTEENKNDFVSQIVSFLKKMDVNQVQAQIGNLSSALSTVQGVISQFQSGNNTNTKANQQATSRRPHPFSFRKD